VIPTRNRTPRRAIRAWTAALLLVCAASLWLRFEHIAATLPYPHHIDEGFVSGPAARTVVEGTLHPYNFNYPSLPKYLAAAGMAAGFLRSASNRELREVKQIGNVGYPYYDAPRVVGTARQVFALLSIVALAATGYAALAAGASPVGIVLAPLVVAATPLYFSDSWRYLNVDIIGACFAMFTLAACLYGTRQPSMLWSAIVPGVLAGCTAGSKYTLALVIAPVLLGIVFFGRDGRRFATSLAALVAMAAAFIVVVPYSLLDFPGFLNGVASEAYHYASGHAGYQGEPGLPQLAYYLRHFLSEFGWAGSILALAGAGVLAVADWRRAIVLLSFPTTLLWLLSTQTVHFVRNVLAAQPFIAILVAIGAVAVHRWASVAIMRRTWRSRPLTRAIAPALAVVIALLAVPPGHIVDQFRDRTDSRNLALTWMEKELPPDWTVVIPDELGMDVDRVQRVRRRVMVVDFQGQPIDEQLEAIPKPAVLLVPQWGADARFPQAEVADALNEAGRRWRVVRTFGANPVLVNYSQPVPSGNPAFAAAIVER
jgi:hypothetical protein